MKTIPFISFALVGCVSSLAAEEFKYVGSFVLRSHYKLTGGRITPIPIKPVTFEVDSDGTRVRVRSGGDNEAASVFEIYRSDGIGRQRPERGALEVVPGLQALSQTGGVVRHLRLTKESLTITTFPGVSDQTIVSHFVPVDPPAGQPRKGEEHEP